MTQKQLEDYLWGAANILRGMIDAADFKQYILFDLICHLGTLLAIFILFAQDILNTVKPVSDQSSTVKISSEESFKAAKPAQEKQNKESISADKFLTTIVEPNEGQPTTVKVVSTEPFKTEKISESEMLPGKKPASATPRKKRRR